ncbi:multidrug efflux RND transporter outer membrane channel subunit OprM [Ramlibacter solisilvae]|uniref:Multidrug transporter n=1 Tax=Ramlibacter tataouinensis TaxID=94132 RepID=A0A127JWL6_9BURK|nr:efflux transporter outer membrane subunit [Ramlibacter tataouinensis]AMO24295.1 multidrug transporter [Ramlibacter tataouinensis]
MKKKLIALGASVFLGACSMIPAYQRPAAPVPDNWGYASAEKGPAAAALPWQDFFADARLKQLIGISLVNNRDLRIAMLNVEQARAAYNIQRADQFPTVGVTVAGSRAPNTSGVMTTQYTAALGFTAWEVDLFGRVASLSQSALAEFFATEEGRKAAQISLVSSVAATWVALVADDEALEITRQTLATREESLRLTRLRFENGATSELDFRLAESLVETARAALAQLTRQRALDLNALALLLGQPVPAQFQTSASTESVQLPDLPAGTPSEVLTGRPDVRQAEQLLMAANANIGAARAAFFPRITLTAGVGRSSSELSRLFQGGAWNWTVAPTLVQPIFDAGRNRANLAATETGRDIAIAQYERAIQSAFREVADSLAGRATFGDQVQALQRAVEAEAVRFKLSELRYNSGVASYLDLLDAQRALYTARLLLVQTRAQQLQSQLLLYKALGGGWTQAS